MDRLRYTADGGIHIWMIGQTHVLLNIFYGEDSQMAVLGMHGKVLGTHDIEVELTDTILTTSVKSCHAGTDIFRMQQVVGFLPRLLLKVERDCMPLEAEEPKPVMQVW